MRALLIAAGFVAGVLLMTIVDHQPWLLASLKHNFAWDNVREWTGALSGWAAVAAAGISLPYLIGQWKEARRQTRFVVGDEEPTLDVIEHLEEEDRLVVRIVNWNRRAVFVWDIVSSTYFKPADMSEYTYVDRVKTQDGETSTEFPIQINGWEDRSKGPCFARIDLLLLSKGDRAEPDPENDEVREFPKDATIWATMQMLGNVHRTFDMSAQAFPDRKLD